MKRAYTDDQLRDLVARGLLPQDFAPTKPIPRQPAQRPAPQPKRVPQAPNRPALARWPWDGFGSWILQVLFIAFVLYALGMLFFGPR